MSHTEVMASDTLSLIDHSRHLQYAAHTLVTLAVKRSRHAYPCGDHEGGNNRSVEVRTSFQEEMQVKKLWMVAIVVTMCAIGAVAQTSIISTTEDVQASSIAAKPFDGCNGDLITLDGYFTQTTSTWVDGNGDTHVRTQVTSSNLTASSSDSSYTYTVVFSQKMVDVSLGVIDQATLDEGTQIFRLKVLGEGPLNNKLFLMMEVHWTTLLNVDTGTNVNRTWSKCTG